MNVMILENAQKEKRVKTFNSTTKTFTFRCLLKLSWLRRRQSCSEVKCCKEEPLCFLECRGAALELRINNLMSNIRVYGATEKQGSGWPSLPDILDLNGLRLYGNDGKMCSINSSKVRNCLLQYKKVQFYFSNTI
jgi:hypothetical protein